MREVLEKFKTNWEIKENYDYLIFLVFLGFGIYLFYKLSVYTLPLFGTDSSTPIYISVIYWLIALVAIYYLSLFTLKLKKKWGLTSNLDLLIIFVIFGLTGTSATRLRAFIFPLIGINEEFPLYIRIILSILIITPCYYIFLIVYGYIFGKFDFCYKMAKKSLGRFGKLFNARKQV